MSTKKTTPKPRGAGSPDTLEAFARHLAEVLRIGRAHPDIPARLYNNLADAWNSGINELPSLGEFQ